MKTSWVDYPEGMISEASKNGPALSVVVPTYNRADRIGVLLESLFLQDFHNMEIIVVDDGSTDDTESEVRTMMASSLQPPEATLHYVRQDNRGASAARNRGVSCSRGAYLFFVDSDDRVTPGGLARAMETIVSGGADFVYGKVQGIDQKGTIVPLVLEGFPYDGSDRGLLDYHWHTMGAVYSRELVDKVGGWNEDLPCSDDWEFQVRIKLSGAKGCFVDELIGYWCLHKEQRLSASSFRPDYVEGVRLACLEITEAVRGAGRFSGVVKTRLIDRLIRHALEAGAHHDGSLRSKLLDDCRSLGDESTRRMVLRFLETFQNHRLDWMLFWLVQKFR